MTGKEWVLLLLLIVGTPVLGISGAWGLRWVWRGLVRVWASLSAPRSLKKTGWNSVGKKGVLVVKAPLQGARPVPKEKDLRELALEKFLADSLKRANEEMD